MTEPQTITLTVEFKIKHTPNSESHLRQVAENYFRSKGIKVEDKKIII